VLHELDEVILKLAGMGMGQPVCAFNIARTDGLQHLVMLIRQQIAAALGFQKPEMQVQHPSALIEQAVIKRGKIDVFARISDGHVESLVRLGHHQMVSGLDCSNESLLSLGDDSQIFVASQFCGKAGVHPLGNIKGFDVFGKALDINRRNNGGPVRQRDNKLVPRKADQRLAYRRARHAEPLGQCHFIKQGTGRQGQGKDLVAQGFIGKLYARPFCPLGFRVVRHHLIQ
jgi:hypothetical protein